MGLIDTLVDFADATRKIMGISRTSPEMFMRRLPIDALKVTSVSALASGLVLVADRWLFRPYEVDSIKTAAVATLVVGIVISISFVFIVATSIILPLVISDRENAEKLANAWTMMFCFIWFLSVLICLLDLIIKIIADANSGPIFAVFSLIGAGRNILGFKGDQLFPCIVYGTLAYAVLLLRSRFADRLAFSYRDSILSFVILVPFSAMIMYLAIWAPLNEFFSKLLSVGV
jgi:hypothetical protein